MRPMTVLWRGEARASSIDRLMELDSVARVIVVAGEQSQRPISDQRRLEVWDEQSSGSSRVLRRLLDEAEGDFLLEAGADGPLTIDRHALERMIETAEVRGAGLVYGDYARLVDGRARDFPLARHQFGSLGEGFALGPIRLWSLRGRANWLGDLPRDLDFHAWYDLRLRVGREDRIVHLQEPLAAVEKSSKTSGKAVFDYLVASRASQVEAETVVTAELRARGALLSGPFQPFEPTREFPCMATIVIPVRDRVATVADAVGSALGQKTDFEFNVIVVDNHSSDGTTALLEGLAQQSSRLIHLVPSRRDLGIGGCWNEAIFHRACGRFAVQLDSDDLYAGNGVLATIVDRLEAESCGMLVGSYSTVDFDLRPVAPGLIDHREWSEQNGPNNALRVDGLGAPRAFATELVRQFPFPNVSYGEDYAVALRICRDFRVGRIYESLYHCRRWQGNTDADAPPALTARRQEYKDGLRTRELAARQQANAQ